MIFSHRGILCEIPSFAVDIKNHCKWMYTKSFSIKFSKLFCRTFERFHICRAVFHWHTFLKGSFQRSLWKAIIHHTPVQKTCIFEIRWYQFCHNHLLMLLFFLNKVLFGLGKFSTVVRPSITWCHTTVWLNRPTLSSLFSKGPRRDKNSLFRPLKLDYTGQQWNASLKFDDLF